MNLHLAESIPAHLPDVLPALERCLRDVAWEVVQTDNKLIAYGIGPSARTINCSDETIVEAQEQSDVTLLKIDVTYQGTTLLSEASQNESVRLRLQQILERLKSELATEADLSSPSSARVTSFPDPKPARPAASTRSPRPNGSALPVHFDEAVAHAAPLPKRTPTLVPTASPEAESAQTTEPWLATSRIPNPPKPPASRRRWPVFLAVAATVIVMGGLTEFSLSRKTSGASAPTQPAATQSQASPVPPPAPSPEHWLESWAAAERSTDPVLQASFYADTVAPYLNRASATRTTILNDKAAAIQARKGLWTFKIEDVTISRTSPTTAEVALVKRIMTQVHPPKVAESFTPTRLTLQWQAGKWSITAEQNLS